MDPCYLREDGDDEDFELYCSNLVIDTYADGYYHVIKGPYEENIGKINVIAESPEGYSIGLFSVDSGRVGVYDYHEAVKEQPKLKERIERGEIIAAIIKHFQGPFPIYIMKVKYISWGNQIMERTISLRLCFENNFACV